ncbi:MAG: 2-oxo acid dehydrogenase subunit E2 [Propionibacteriaceae bacterium]|nr:2-oxo acid dehydrogenase subunit E2 [Propionibacteriaceae bacterium]
MAQQKGVDLDTVVGSGVGGRIRKQDVLEAAGEVAAPTLARGIPNSPVQASPVPPVASPAPVAAPVPAATAPSQPTQPPVYATPAAASPATVTPTTASPDSDPGRANDYLGRPGSSPGTAVASTTPAAASPVPAPATPYPPRAQQTSPYAPISAAPVAPRHAEPRNEVLPLTVTLEVDLTAIARGITQGGYIGTSDHVPFVIRAAAETLKEAPMLNAQLDGTLKYSQQVNIAVPMDTASGRVAPVLQNVGEMSLVNVINSLGELRGRASAGALLPADLLGATFTVVDYSASGVLFDTPVVTPPQVAALGVGACQRRPVVVNDPLTGESIGIRDMVYLSLTYDNRAIQISQASHFMHLLKSRLEAGA